VRARLPVHIAADEQGRRAVMTEQTRPGDEVATLGGGCFWCLEAVFKDLEGVRSVRSGYAGGHVPNPTYKQVCTGRTGHAEVTEIVFDPAVLAYEDLLRVFFSIHDPTTRDRQGNDVGPQYRSIILTHSDAQRASADTIIREVNEAKIWPAPLVTEVVALERFYPAEPEHDDYFARNPWTGYCQVVIAPKVAKFRKTFAHRLKSGAS